MAAPTKQAVEVARQFRKALALDLVTSAVPDAYELLKLTVKEALDGIKNNPSYITNRQQLDAAKVILGMGGVLESQRELDDKDVARMSLADLEKMIAGLKVIEPDAPIEVQPDDQPIDIFS